MISYYIKSYIYVSLCRKCHMQHLYSFMNKELFEAWWHWMQNLQMLSFILQVFSTPPHMFNNVNCIYYSTCCQTHYCRKNMLCCWFIAYDDNIYFAATKNNIFYKVQTYGRSGSQKDYNLDPLLYPPTCWILHFVVLIKN